MKRVIYNLIAAMGLGALAYQAPARAVLTYSIYETGGNVVVEASGSLNLPATSVGTSFCNNGAALFTSGGEAIITGPSENNPNFVFYSTSGGPSSLIPSQPGAQVHNAPSTGTQTCLGVSNDNFGIIGYTSGDPISSTATFAGTTLASFGFTTTGLIGTWSLDSGDTITVSVTAPPSPSTSGVPAPLPLLGTGAAFSFSRRLRRRVGLGQRSLPLI